MNDNDLLDKYGLLPKSNAPKKAVTEGDELLSKYGLNPVEEVKDSTDDKGQKWWQGLNADTSYEGVAKRFGIGIARGAKDVLDTAAHGLGNAASYVAGKVLPASIANKIEQSVEQTKAEDLAARNEFNKEYPSSSSLVPNATDVGRTVGQIAATAPVMPTGIMAGIARASNALPIATATGKIAAPLANRLVSAAGQGAVGGGVFGAATSSANDKSLAENVGEGVLTGGLAGPVLPIAANVGKGVGSTLLSSISPERAALARRAADYGIDVDAGQVSNSPIFKKYNQVSGWLPFSGAQKASDKQIGQFTKAVSNTFGENSENITPKVIDKAKQRIGNDYETVAKNTSIPVDQQLIRDLANVTQHADLMLSPDQMSVFKKQLENVIGKFQQGNGVMDGEVWQGMRKTTEPLSTIANANKNTTLGQAVKGLKVAMDSAFNRSAPPEMQGLLRQANGQYKAMKTIEKLANTDEEGQISPLKLMSKVVNNKFGGKAGSGDLGELADIGRAFFPTPADSGTPLGELVADKLGRSVAAPVSALAAGAHALASGGFILPTAESVGGILANRAIRSAVNSGPVKEAILNKAEGNTYGVLDKAAEKAIPYSSNLLSNKNKKQLTRVYIDGSSRLPLALEK